MKLKLDELRWIEKRMEIYVIKFQEIYDEILDHIITAIEERRENGDARAIEMVFQQVVDDDFDGYAGIESLAVTAERIYRKNIRSLFYNRLKQLLNLQTMVVAIVLLVASYYMPDVKYVHVVLLGSIFLLAVSPIFYAGISIAGKTRTMRGKKSLLKSYLIAQVALPMALLNAFIYLPQVFIDEDFKIFKQLPPIALMVVLLVFLVTNVSYMQSSKELIDKNKLNQPVVGNLR